MLVTQKYSNIKLSEVNYLSSKSQAAMNHTLGEKKTYSFSVYVKFPSIDGIGPDNWL